MRKKTKKPRPLLLHLSDKTDLPIEAVWKGYSYWCTDDMANISYQNIILYSWNYRPSLTEVREKAFELLKERQIL